MSKLIVTRRDNTVVTAVEEDGRIVELTLDPEETEIRVGDIFLGRVQNVVKNIQAAFVELNTEGVVGFYHLMDRQKPPVVGSEILVQVTREAVKTKAASVSTELSLPGRYVVLCENGGRTAVSGKIIPGERREALKRLLEPFCSASAGFIVRTNAEYAMDEEIRNEARILMERYCRIREQAKHRTVFSCLLQSCPSYLSTVRDLRAESMAEIVTDDPELFSSIQDFLLEHLPEDAAKLRFYEDRLLPLTKLYRLETVQEEALKKRVWLKSGGYLVIEPTEALTVIDVNTGKYDGHKNLQDTFLKINCEAAEEIAVQLRLRNLSGIIIVDFIDMEGEERNQELLKTFADSLKHDPVKTVLVEQTKLGLVELTRKKVRRPLHEQVKNRR